MPQISVRAEGIEKDGNKTSTPGGARSVSPEVCASCDCSHIKYVCIYHSSINHFRNMSLWCSAGIKISKASGDSYKNEEHINGWGTKECFPKCYSFSYKGLEASTLVSKALKLITGSKNGPILTAPTWR